VMTAARVPVAEPISVARPPCVVKADGLAAGKGVFVCRTQDELDAGLLAATALGGPILIEELLEGEEISVFAVCDGRTAVALPAAQDFKRAFDADEGPNTGGMGSFSGVPGWGAAQVEEALDLAHRPVLAELATRGTPFVGVLYAGLMLTADGPRVLEFNCRFGDPETQSIIPLVEGDLLGALWAAARGELEGVALPAPERSAVTVVLAAGGYPEAGDSGTPIERIAEAEAAGALVFHAGTALRDGKVVTNGGRILGVTGVASTLAEARERAYAGADLISFPGMRYRSDIARDAARA
jgi:phosphoribosylamine--glycine ligase